MTTPLNKGNVATVDIPTSPYEPAGLRNAPSARRRVAYMIAFGQRRDEILGAKIEGVAEPWVMAQLRPRTRNKWVKEAVQWVVERISNDEFRASNKFDTASGILAELERIYDRQMENDELEAAQKTCVNAGDILKLKFREGQGRRKLSAPGSTYNIVEYHADGAGPAGGVLDTLRSRVKDFGPTIPGGPELALTKRKPRPKKKKKE